MKSLLRGLLLIGIIFIAFILRGPITAVGPIIDLIKQDYNLSSSMAGMITTLPLIAFAIVSPFVAKISDRFNYNFTILSGLIIIVFGEIFRYYTGVWGLYVGTAFIGVGIAMENVLLPSIIKLKFPQDVGRVTSVYLTSLSISSTIGAACSVPLASKSQFGWSGSLAIWSILTIISILIWLPQIKNTITTTKDIKNINISTKVSIWRSPVAWWVTLFMGLQTLLFFCFVTWLPSILIAKGLSIEFAGEMALLYQLISMPTSIVIPVMSTRLENQKMLSTITSIGYLFGMFLLLITNSPFMIVLSVIFIGLSAGSYFSLSFIYFSLRTSNAQRAAELSGMAQSGGYLMAALGPVLMGMLYDRNQSWDWPIIIFCLVIIIMIYIGLKAGENKIIE